MPQVEVFDVLRGDKIDVASTGTAYSKTFEARRNVDYAFEYQAESDGAVDIKVELEQGNVLPATEGGSSTDFVVPEGAATLDDTLTDENNHVKAYTPAVSKYMRFKFTGQGSNHSSTKIAKLNVCASVKL